MLIRAICQFMTTLAIISLSVTTAMAAPFAYVPNHDGASVSVIDTAANLVTATIPVGLNPYGVATAPVRGKVYITNRGDNTVSVINSANNTVSATIAVETAPTGVAVSPDETKVYVANFGSHSVSVINTASNSVITTIPVDDYYPFGLAITPDNSKVFVTCNYTNNKVSVITTASNTVTATITVGNEATGIVITPDGSTAYVGNHNSGTVSVINTVDNSIITTITVAPDLFGLAISPDGTKIYTSSYTHHNVYVINTSNNTLTRTIPCTDEPFGISFSPDGTKAYVAMGPANTVKVLDTASDTIIASIPVGSNPYALGTAISAFVPNANGLSIPFRDEFNRGLRPEWLITNPNPATITPQTTSLRLTTTATDLAGTTDNLQNLLTLRLPPDADNFAVTAKFSFSVQPGTNSQQIGVVLLRPDPDNTDLPSMENYYRSMYGYNDGLAFGYARDIFNNNNSQHNNFWEVTIDPGASFWIRVTKTWKTAEQYVYRSSYSTDGVTFTGYVEGEQPFPFTHVGIFALHGVGNSTPLAFDVDFVEVTPLTQAGTMPSGLISWWAADNNPNDALGLNHANLVGSPSYETGIANQAFSFDGSSQYAQVNAPVSLPVGAAPRTISGWIKTSGPTSDTKYQAMLGYGSPGIDRSTFLVEWGGDDNDRKLYLTGWNADLAGNTQLEYNQWYQVVATYDGTTVKLYVNGVEDASENIALNTVLNADGLMIGTSPPTGNDGRHSFFNGLIEDVAIFDRALIPQEIQLLATTLPVVTTAAATNITASSVTSGGTVTALGGSSVIARGVCRGTTANPDINNGICVWDDPSDTGSFTSAITGLTAGTVYHLRAFARTLVGFAYGEDRQFTTLAGAAVTTATVTTAAVTGITDNTATTGGTVTAENGAAVTVRGVCWKTSVNPTINDSCSSDGSGAGAFASTIYNLTANTTYHVRAYATNSAGTAYGADIPFTTALTPATVTTASIIGSAVTTVSAGGTVVAAGDAPVTERGICWGTSLNPAVGNTCTIIGAGIGTFSTSITGLALNTTYHVRAYAVSAAGTAYGANIQFTTATPVGPFAYITNQVDNTASVIDTATNRVVSTITTGDGPRGVALYGSLVYLANSYDGTISIIDASSNTIIGSPIAVGVTPNNIAINPAGTKLYAGDSNAQAVYTLDTASKTVAADPPSVNNPWGLIIHPSGNSLYAVSSMDNVVWSINTSSGAIYNNVPVGMRPRGIAITPDGNRLYVADGDSNSVSIINTGTYAVTTISVGNGPRGVAITPDGSKVYVTNQDSNSVSVIDTSNNAILSTIAVQSGPYGIAINPTGSHAYAVNRISGTVSVIDTSTDSVVQTIAVGNSPYVLGQFIGSFTVSAPDTTPDAFTFTDHINVGLNNLSISDAITVSGINTPTTISITGGEYQINGGNWTAANGTVVNGNIVAVRQTSSGTGGVTTDAVLTIGGVSDAFSVTTIVLPTFTVTPGAGAGGSISPGMSQTVTQGATTQFTITPNSGYHLTGISGTCGGSLGGVANTIYSTNAITGNCTVIASFAINVLIVTSTAGANGSINPNTTQSVSYGSTTQFTITPATGYRIDGVGGTCGGTLDGTLYTTNAVTAACTVTANFIELNTFQVTPLSGTHGSISPNTLQIVNSGATKNFIIAADPGYMVDTLLSDCGSSIVGNSYTTDPIAADCTITVGFKKIYAEIDGYDPNANNAINSLAIQQDGKIIAGGAFTAIGGQVRNHIARLNEVGTADNSFNPNANDVVTTIAVQPDGKIIVGGDFTAMGGVTRNHIARLNPDGTLDLAFNPNANLAVYALVLQTDGKIVVGGEFTTISGQARNHIARLNADGSLDTAFNPDASNAVAALIMQPNGKILAGGAFYVIGGQQKQNLARLNQDGTVDTSFSHNLIGSVNTILVQPDGKIVVGGHLSSIEGLNRGDLARLEPNGSLDRSFDPRAYGTSGSVYSLLLQPDGKIVAAGTFDNICGQSRNHIARLNPNGTLDTSFDPNANFFIYSPYYALALQKNGKVVVGGWFTKMGGLDRNNTARLNTDGSVETTLPDTGVTGQILAVAFQADNKIIVGGYFTIIAGQNRTSFARLNANGSLDSAFNPNLGNSPQSSLRVHAIALQPDGKILIGGDFTSVGGQSRNSIARLNPDGTLDASFVPPLFSDNSGTSKVYALTVQSDGKILVSGYFVPGNGLDRTGIARLNPDGTLDTTFTADKLKPVYSFIVQPDGKIIVGGKFYVDTANGAGKWLKIARLNANGAMDSGFNAEISLGTYEDMGAVYALARQPDGKILIAGQFDKVNGQTRNNFARLNSDGTLDTLFNPNANDAVKTFVLQTDGKIVIGGDFSLVGGVGRYHVALINADGSLDSTFNPNSGPNALGTFPYSLGVQPDGKIVAGGQFAKFGYLARNGIVRLGADASALQELVVSNDGSTVTWLRSGSAPEIFDVTFEYSADSVTWATVGTGTRIPGGWQLTGLSLPFKSNSYIRVRGKALSGQYNGSNSLIESVRLYYNRTNTGIVTSGGMTPSISDALAVLQYVDSAAELTPAQLSLADVAPLGADGMPQGNGVVDEADVIMLLRRIVGANSW